LIKLPVKKNKDNHYSLKNTANKLEFFLWGAFDMCLFTKNLNSREEVFLKPLFFKVLEMDPGLNCIDK